MSIYSSTGRSRRLNVPLLGAEGQAGGAAGAALGRSVHPAAFASKRVASNSLPRVGSPALLDEDSQTSLGRKLLAAPKILITGREKKCHFALLNLFSNLPGKSTPGAAGLVDDFPDSD